MVLDRLRLPANRNCYRLSRVSWAFLKLLVGTDMAKTIELCKVYSFFILLNLRQRTTVWNTNASNCYITWCLFVSDCSPLHHELDRKCYTI